MKLSRFSSCYTSMKRNSYKGSPLLFSRQNSTDGVVSLTIAKVPEKTARQFKALAVRNGMNYAKALEVLVKVGEQAEQNLEANEASK